MDTAAKYNHVDEEAESIVTRKEVAELAGVSEATVSRVMSGVGPIKAETKQRVLEAAQSLNYHPNAIAQSFARRRSGNLGVVLPYVPKVHIFSTYYFSEVLSGIGEQVKEMGYDMLLMFRTPGVESDYMRIFRSQKVDACIILGATDTPGERAELRTMAEAGLPFGLVNQHFSGERFLEIDADHTEGSYSAVKHLIARGYRRIAFLNGSPQYSNSGDRLRGYVQAMREAGLLPGVEAHPADAEAIPPHWYYEGNYSRTSGYKAAAEMVRNRDRIDAVFASNDRMAIGLMQGLREHGIVPGRDIAIVGYDDSDAARVTDPPLTSVAVPFYEMGRLAAEKVLTRAAGGSGADEQEPPVSMKLDTKLVIRQSCER
ncbi:LacI family DNA-binding transcriptional regulator [Paenibacillus allorhizosphaerae]|uniref:HTH-type transcriptional regulator DegA n=1 Tax=Paenibacillus allorhizosphaerae TaxID=2849866 RepID=A0ABN7TS74_9BACL|nr:LacI family DNA-binding transcriptional regulator [Paenibacillus allorhizosphaerae]CAG7649031.1 HTH-type transcriptional regulator DegA [Paenibacillus allorhizosphaerae]